MFATNVTKSDGWIDGRGTQLGSKSLMFRVHFHALKDRFVSIVQPDGTRNTSIEDQIPPPNVTHPVPLNVNVIHSTPTDKTTRQIMALESKNAAASSVATATDQNAPSASSTIASAEQKSVAEAVDDTQFQFSLKIYACVYPWIPWKVAAQLWSWEREHGIVDIYDVDEEQTVMPSDACYLLVGERAMYDPYGNIILLCRNISKENIYVKGVTKLRPVSAIFHEIVNSRTDFPSLLEHMDNLCMQNVLQEEERLTVQLPEQKERFQEVYDLFETVVRGEKARERKFRWVQASVKRWSANVERYFLTENGEHGEASGDNKDGKASESKKTGEVQEGKK